MQLIRWFLLTVLLVVGGAVLYFWLAAKPPQVPFAPVGRGDIVSTVVTNGQVEPLEASEIRAASAGKVARIPVAQGGQVAAGVVVLQMEDDDARIQLEDAQAALEAAEARLRQMESGGSPLRQQELDGSIAAARLTLLHAQEEAAKVRRLMEANAATARELEVEQRRIAVAQENLASLEAQRRLLLSDADRRDAQSAVAAARARVDTARRRRADAVVRSPAAGTLYEFTVKPGTWLQPGDLLGRVGDLSTLRILLFVDEPELGRVREGLPVTIRWDAWPGVTWKGVVDRLPTRIQTFGTRQVGEVVCRIQNPEGNLLPGANVNAEIVSARETSTLVVPKQTIRRRLGAEGVWKLDGAVLRWQPVRVGVSSVTEAQILEGVAEGDRVALLVDRELRDGMEVQPVTP